MKLFVLHCSKLIDRKEHILSQFKKHNITDFEFIEKFNKDEITYDESNVFSSSYNKSTMSLHLKHNYAYKLIAEYHDLALIVEDDVFFCDNFVSILNIYMYQLPKDFDMLFIGDGCDFHIENNRLIPNKFIYEKCLYPTYWGGAGITRCCDSYIVSKKCAIQLCDYINNLKEKIDSPIDHWLNTAARDNNFKVYTVEYVKDVIDKILIF
jgi:GR25 family glycosyltransferase involved in LPS biosynthesis